MMEDEALKEILSVEAAWECITENFKKYDYHPSYLERIQQYGLWYEVAHTFHNITKGVMPTTPEDFYEAINEAMLEWDM